MIPDTVSLQCGLNYFTLQVALCLHSVLVFSTLELAGMCPYPPTPPQVCFVTVGFGFCSPLSFSSYEHPTLHSITNLSHLFWEALLHSPKIVESLGLPHPSAIRSVFALPLLGWPWCWLPGHRGQELCYLAPVSTDWL